MKEEIYKTKISLKTKFDLKDFYTELFKFLSKLEWKGVLGENYYETYQYCRISPEGTESYEIVWELTKEFKSEDPKITWYLNIIIRVFGYNKRTLTGNIEIEIKGSHEIEEKEPEIKSLSERVLSFIGFSKNILKEEYKKSKIKGSKKSSIIALAKECESIKKWIHNYFKAYYY